MNLTRLTGPTLLATLFALAPTTAHAQAWNQPAVYTLPTIDLSSFINRTTGVAGVNDHGVELGGIGSDLWRGAGDEPGVYWMITDRGPNGEGPRTFPVHSFTPTILKVRTIEGRIEILQAIPITGANDAAFGVTGLPNLLNTSEPPAPNELFYACDGTTPVPTNPVTGTSANPNGIDAEGLVRTRDGYFWVVEEYSPSLLKIDPNGRVVKRYFPANLLDFFPVNTPTGYAADDSPRSIPEIFGRKRKLNRGFEGLALSVDEKTLYLGLQSPLNNPDATAGNNARNTRILAFDIGREMVTAEYAYRFQPASEFAAPVGQPANRTRDMKLSALVALDQRRLAVLERTDFIAKVYVVDLKDATNLLGSRWDDRATSPTLEQITADGALELAGVTPLPKSLVATFDSTQGFPQKIEGIAVLNGETLAIANDNDFGVGAFTGSGAACALTSNNGFESQIRVVKLPSPIK